ncbi:hypothetical protein [Lyngbya sp. PCC 8106]|nr:hypothetical protein [Lyngbya sp. PCC 8106]
MKNQWGFENPVPSKITQLSPLREWQKEEYAIAAWTSVCNSNQFYSLL